MTKKSPKSPALKQDTTKPSGRPKQNVKPRIPAFGRPLKFQTVADLEKAINAYFESLYEPMFDMWGNPIKNKETGEPRMRKSQVATVTGLAVALETTRETLMDYENGKHDGKDESLSDEQIAENKQIDDFSDTIKKAKLRIYADTEQQLYGGKAIGAIFSLKNNYGWRDEKEVKIGGKAAGDREVSDAELDEAIFG